MMSFAMRKYVNFFLTFILLSVSIQGTVSIANSYEMDTHLRLTYVLARSVGIDDKTAKYLAYGDQYIDKSFLTIAMHHPAIRALYHFTGSFYSLKSSAHGGEGGVLNSIKELFWSRKVSLAERNHAVGNYLIYLGFTKGDLMLVSQGLHVKQDTYGHAGFTNFWGHIFDGHNPDRVFLETQKYEDMIRSLVQTLVSARDLLPEENLDHKGALDFLNKFSSSSFLGRDLNVEDLKNATTVSGVLLNSSELRSIYSENIFNNYKYKKLVLEMVYEDFKSRNVINGNIPFSKLFPEALIKNNSMDVTDTIKFILVADMESDFLKNKDGIDLLNTEKLFGLKSQKELFDKMALEEERYQFRLRDFEKKRKRLKEMELNNEQSRYYEVEKTALEKEYLELSLGLNLHNVNEEINRIMLDIPEELKNEIATSEMEIRKKYSVTVNNVLTELDSIKKQSGWTDAQFIQKFVSGEIYAETVLDAMRNAGEVEAKIREEISEMRRDKLFEIFVRIRARQLSQLKLSTEIADLLTKDFIPRAYSQYIKQSFEGNTIPREFEVKYKDEHWRRFIQKHFNSNWVIDEVLTSPSKLASMIYDFKKIVYRKGALADAKRRRMELNLTRAAAKMAKENILIEDTGREIGDIKKAQVLSYNFASNFAWIKKTLGIVIPITIPFYGEVHLRKIEKLAQKFAKVHETEGVQKGLESGQYRILNTNPNEHVGKQLEIFAGSNNNTVSNISCKALF